MCRQASMGARHSSGGLGQPAELGQLRLQQKLGQNHPRHLLDRTQPVQGHAPR